MKEHEQFRELLRYLLQIDPRQRPSAREALGHGFFRTEESSPPTMIA